MRRDELQVLRFLEMRLAKKGNARRNGNARARKTESAEAVAA
jgi:hypothetical protein